MLYNSFVHTRGTIDKYVKKFINCAGSVFRPGETRFMSFHALLKRVLDIQEGLNAYFSNLSNIPSDSDDQKNL